MYACTTCGPTRPATTPARTADAMNAMALIARSTPASNLGPRLTGAGNRATVRPGGRSQRLMDTIAPADLRLCRLMSSLRAGRESRNAQAEVVIANVEGPRRALAQRTADGLRDWLCRDGRPHFSLVRRRLQMRVQHAGLMRTLSRLPAGELSEAQRRGIANALIDVGARTKTVGGLLGLPPATLRTINPLALRDRLMSLEQLSMLQDPALSPIARQNRRAEAYSRAVLVGERFGYSARLPPWKFIPATPGCARTTLLKELTGSLEASRRGIDVQLP